MIKTKVIENDKFYVYGLINPITCLPFYVGKGCGRRSSTHLNTNSKENSFKTAIVKNLYSKDLEPTIVYYAKNLTNNEALNFEKIIISSYGRIRLDENGILTNRCEGGTQPPRITREYINTYLGDEWKLKQSEKKSKRQKGVPKKYNCLANFGETHIRFGKDNGFYGKHHTGEFKERQSKNKKGNTDRLGKKCSNKTKRLVSLNNPNRKTIVTPHGIYSSAENFANTHLNISPEGLHNILKNSDIIITRMRADRCNLFSRLDIGKTPRKLGWYYL